MGLEQPVIRNVGSHFRRVWIDGQCSEMDFKEICKIVKWFFSTTKRVKGGKKNIRRVWMDGQFCGDDGIQGGW